MVVVVLLLALVAASSGAAATSKARPCGASLPRGPAVPAPIVLRTSCGGFRLAPDGTVTRLPRSWFDARSGGTGRRYGADLRIERTRPGRIVLLRQGRVVWRSHGLNRNDGESMAFGPGAFAFAAHRRGIFVTDLRGPERLIVRGVGLYPLAFLRDGTLLVVRGGAGTIRLVAPDGTLLRRYDYRRKNGYAFDQRTESLFFVTPSRMLVRAHGSAVRPLRPLRNLDGWVWLAGRHVTLSDEERLAVLRRDGSLVSRWSWRVPRGSRLDLSPVSSEDGRRGAFRTVPTDGRGPVVVYVLREGERRPRAAYRHRGNQVGCGVGSTMEWHDEFVLYSATDGPTVLIDARSGRAQSLAELAALLPRRFPGERPLAFWASDIRPNRF